MQVKIMNRTYPMSRKEYEGFLEFAKEQVPYGIYMVECDGYAEARHDNCTSATHLKKLIRGFKSKGIKVYANWG